MAYQNIINKIAFGVLNKKPQIPDYHLMVGTAEVLGEVPLLVPQGKIPVEVAKALETMSKADNETIVSAIQNNTLEINDFNGNTAIIGSVIGGVR